MRYSAGSMLYALVALAAGCGEAARPAPAANGASPEPSGIDRPSTPGGGDAPAADPGSPSDTYPAPHPAPPAVVTRGGHVLTWPRIVPVVFDDDPYAPEIERFVGALATSRYWSDATAEYGIGALRVEAAVRVTGEPPATLDDDGIQSWLADHLDGTHDDWPAPDPSTFYALFFPRYVSVADARWGKGCIDFAGYHWETTLASGARVPYAVIPRCSSWMELHGFDVVTAAASHELVEAATDPLPQSSPGFAAVDQDHKVWTLFPLSELGDMCTVNPDPNFRPADLDYLVQHTWSNAAARAHHDPCGGAGGAEAYFNTAPVLEDDVTIAMVSRSVPTKGVKIPLGESRTIELDLFSDGPTGGPWTVTAKDVASLGGRNPSLSFQLDRTQGRNGEKLHLTITAVREGQSGGAEFMLVSTLGSRATTWFGFVAN